MIHNLEDEVPRMSFISQPTADGNGYLVIAQRRSAHKSANQEVARSTSYTTTILSASPLRVHTVLLLVHARFSSSRPRLSNDLSLTHLRRKERERRGLVLTGQPQLIWWIIPSRRGDSRLHLITLALQVTLDRTDFHCYSRSCAVRLQLFLLHLKNEITTQLHSLPLFIRRIHPYFLDYL